MRNFVTSLVLIVLSFSANAAGLSAEMTATEAEQYKNKVLLDSKFYALKIAEESKLKKSSNLSLDVLTRTSSPSGECIDWVYQGPASREEAARACRGVILLDCAKWVYQGPASRVEAAMACYGVTDMSCVESVYRGPASRVEAAQACGSGGCY
ncbi:MAG: hypothetical protein JNM39_09190 [Bdellovibrionaceae bacterium]|nr:hypothetical protein [Pseudobdellovibrionaceae bacterium]